MKKRVVIIIIILLVIFGGTFAWDALRSFFIKQYFAHFQMPAVSVSTTKVIKKNWPRMLSGVGTLTAVNGVDINSRVEGQVVAIYFQSGQMVTQGQPLIQLDDTLDQQAFKNNQAQATLDKVTYQRQLDLLKKNAVSQNDVDVAKAKMLQSQSNAETAALNIFHKSIKAPFAGKIGIRNFNIGQYITPGQALVTLQSLDPLFVDFSLPEQDLRWLQTQQEILITVDAYPGKIFIGKISAINAKVDINTHTISVRAIVQNKNNDLYPGLFANVQVILPELMNVLVIPQTAISYSLYGDLVFVVTQSGTDKKGNPILIAKQRFITVDDRRGNEVIVTSGLKEGEEVVTSGQLKLNDGTTIKINNSISINN